ncbi:MAG: prenyltransferase/squalene oxidase repeat-containing protein [Pirellulales bacterium]|nr:prenyltransferase/squalene oxidase repeat-containing protein [Pirellulales bacterium]
MSSALHDSSLQFLPPSNRPPHPATGTGGPPSTSLSPNKSKLKSGEFWLDGEVVGCACPECRGPMSIRLWLMLADCAMCGASLELTLEQEREIHRLLEQSQPQLAPPVSPPATPPAARTTAPQPTKPRPPSPQTRAVPSTQPATARSAAKVSSAKIPAPAPAAPIAKTVPPPPRSPAVPPPLTVVAPLVSPPVVAAPPVQRQQAPASQQQRQGTRLSTAAHPRHWDEGDEPGHWNWDNLIAFLASTIFHIILVMLLALWNWTASDEERSPRTLLAATWGTAEKEGDKPQPEPEENRPINIDPGPEETPLPPEPPPPEEPPKPPVENIQPAPEPTPELPELKVAQDEQLQDQPPTLDQLKTELATVDAPRMHQGRDPRVRSQLVEHEGGTIFTEAAVAQGLRWISQHQGEDGHWSLGHFSQHGECRGRCDGLGHAHSNTAATGLALLPFLGAGQTHRTGIYKEHVKRGLEWLVAAQESNGDLRGEGLHNMYAHGIAALALCEAYSLTKEDWLKVPAQKAIDFIVSAQDKRSNKTAGGWRYEPGQPGDLSVVGWQLMALHSARHAGLHVEPQTLKRAEKFMKSVGTGEYGGLFSYMPKQAPTSTMIAEGLLCMQYLGWPSDHKGMQEGIDHMLHNLPSPDQPNIYYWYYATQVMHHLGGEPWETWNDANMKTLLILQETTGHESGSWAPAGGSKGGHDVQQGGRLYMTALAVCTLEVYYRHLPLYRTIKIK